MPVRCPKCSTLLAEGTLVCAHCGRKLRQTSGTSLTGREITGLIAETLKVILIPLGIAVVVGGGCLLLLLLV